MSRWVGGIAFLLVLGACRDGGRVDRARPADIAAGAGGRELYGLEPGVEFEAPRRIPAVRARIHQLVEDDRAGAEDLAAFQGDVRALLVAMEADLNRVGVGDAGYFYVLSDSIRRELEDGDAAPVSPAGTRRAAGRVERLITMYERRMRQAADSL